MATRADRVDEKDSDIRERIMDTDLQAFLEAFAIIEPEPMPAGASGCDRYVAYDADDRAAA